MNRSNSSSFPFESHPRFPLLEEEEVDEEEEERERREMEEEEQEEREGRPDNLTLGAEGFHMKSVHFH